MSGRPTSPPHRSIFTALSIQHSLELQLHLQPQNSYSHIHTPCFHSSSPQNSPGKLLFFSSRSPGTTARHAPQWPILIPRTEPYYTEKGSEEKANNAIGSPTSVLRIQKRNPITILSRSNVRRVERCIRIGLVLRGLYVSSKPLLLVLKQAMITFK